MQYNQKDKCKKQKNKMHKSDRMCPTVRAGQAGPQGSPPTPSYATTDKTAESLLAPNDSVNAPGVPITKKTDINIQQQRHGHACGVLRMWCNADGWARAVEHDEL